MKVYSLFFLVIFVGFIGSSFAVSDSEFFAADTNFYTDDILYTPTYYPGGKTIYLGHYLGVQDEHEESEYDRKPLFDLNEVRARDYYAINEKLEIEKLKIGENLFYCVDGITKKVIKNFDPLKPFIEMSFEGEKKSRKPHPICDLHVRFENLKRDAVMVIATNKDPDAILIKKIKPKKLSDYSWIYKDTSWITPIPFERSFASGGLKEGKLYGQEKREQVKFEKLKTGELISKGPKNRPARRPTEIDESKLSSYEDLKLVGFAKNDNYLIFGNSGYLYIVYDNLKLAYDVVIGDKSYVIFSAHFDSCDWYRRRHFNFSEMVSISKLSGKEIQDWENYYRKTYDLGFPILFWVEKNSKKQGLNLARYGAFRDNRSFGQCYMNWY